LNSALNARRSRRAGPALPLDFMCHLRSELRASKASTKSGEAQSESTVLAVRHLTGGAGGSVSQWEFRNLAGVLAPQFQPWQLAAKLFTLLGALAMLVAGAGILGAVAYAATQRTKELGIRRALGASSTNIVGIVVHGGVEAVGGGCLIGVALTLLLGRLSRASLYGVSTADPWSICAAIAVVMLVGVIASLPPALRAARIHPMTALRSD